jgi:hypothetical protein
MARCIDRAAVNSLRSVNISDQGLKHLRNMKLTGLELMLANDSVSDEGLKHLQRLPLTHLWLGFVKNDNITDKGLGYLHAIKTLKRLHFHPHGTKATEEGVRQLQNALPGLRIVGNK